MCDVAECVKYNVRMMKIVNFSVIILFIVLLNSFCDARVPKKVLCGDPTCSEPISLATTKSRYNSNHKNVLSFMPNVNVKIFSKPVDKGNNLWGAEIQGRRGYVPKNFMTETKILKKEVNYEVETPEGIEENNSQIEASKEAAADVKVESTETLANIKNMSVEVNIENVIPPTIPSPVLAESEIIDGTTIAPHVSVDPVIPNEDSSRKNSESDEVKEKIDNNEAAFDQNKTLAHIEADGPEKLLSVGTQEDISEKSSETASSVENENQPIENGEAKGNELVQNDLNIDLNTLELKNITNKNDNSSNIKEQISVEKTPEEPTLNYDSHEFAGGEKTSDEIISELSNDIPAPVHENVDETAVPSNIEESIYTNIPPFQPLKYDGNIKTNVEPELREHTQSNESSVEQESLPSSQLPVNPEENIPNATQTLADFRTTLENDGNVNEQETSSSVLSENTVSINKPSDPKPDHMEIRQDIINSENILSDNGEKIFQSAPQERIGDTVLSTQENLNLNENSNYFLVENIFPNDDNEERVISSISEESIKETVKSNEDNPNLDKILESSNVDNSLPSIENTDKMIPTFPQEGIGSVVELTQEKPFLEKNPESNIYNENSKPNNIKIEETIEDQPGIFSGLFKTLIGLWGGQANENFIDHVKAEETNLDKSLDEILYPEKYRKAENIFDENEVKIAESGHCENLSPNVCPHSLHREHANGIKHQHLTAAHKMDESKVTNHGSQLNVNEFVILFMENILNMSDLILCLGITALTLLIFSLGHYCFVKCRKENSFITKLNTVERNLMLSHKECSVLKGELMDTQNKLASIEDNSFGSNEMVISLKRQLESSELSKKEFQNQVIALEKELENAAEAGLELNRMVSELLSNQSGSDSIISSVEELQKQLNEQQETILSINTLLAEKSRENSELQVILAEQSTKFETEMEELKQDYQKLEEEKSRWQLEVSSEKSALEEKLATITKERNTEIVRLKQELFSLQTRYDEVNKTFNLSESRVEALEEYMKTLKKGPNIDLTTVMNAANLKAQLLSVTKEKNNFKEKLEEEHDARKLLEDHVKVVSKEVSNLRQEYNQAEKDKLEAQTRLEVLSSYFKDKETQLQKELSIKEAMWMQSQGETTSTVEKIRAMQEEIQTLKSQNDSLRAEIEAQSAAHKAQIGALENRAHESWLATRQTERRLEEARSESSTLRRKLTSIVGNGGSNENNMQTRVNNSVDGIPNDLNAPSPLHMESPASPLMGVLPPPPFLPPPFMPPPHTFMPPFIPAEMRPPPLGRLMSPPPPPPSNRYSPSLDDRGNRYSPDRSRYTPDRYNNYSSHRMSPYETETDVSPPPSPDHHRPGGGYRGYKAYSPPPPSSQDHRNKKTKGGISSGGSVDSTRGDKRKN